MQKVTRERAYEETLKYFGGDELATTVWINKYALKDSEGNLYESTPAEMHRRIADELARVDKKYPNPLSSDFYFSLLDKFKYVVPQGSPMAGIGNNLQTVSLSNCYVIGNEGSSDSYGGIMKTDQEQVQLMKRRAGVGHDLSHIRPKGSPVKNSALTSTGVVPFMERYSNSTREVAQDGRRGALMLSIDVTHPDVMDFINAKLELGKVTGANISVKIYDEWMEIVDRTTDEDVNRYKYLVDLGEKINSEEHLELMGLEDKIVYVHKFYYPNGEVFERKAIAKELFNVLIYNAWKSAEPGALFWSQILKESIAECYSEYGFANVSTNPCGEIPISPGDSCRLTLINLFSYINEPFSYSPTFNYDKLKEHSAYVCRIMDNIVDLELEKINSILEKIENDPEDEEVKRTEKNLWLLIKKMCEYGRRTGAGVTAEGDMIAGMNLKYGTKEATDFATNVHKIYATEYFRESVNLAKDRGHFPVWNWELEKENPYINRILEGEDQLREDLKNYGRRNIAMMTIAPAGSVSCLTQTTSGIEPAFMVYYTRRRKVNPNDKNVRVDFVDTVGDSWEEYNVFHHKFVEWFIAKNPSMFETKNEYQRHLELLSFEDVNKLIELSPYYKAMANDVDWVEKVRMQGSIQEYVDHSISCCLTPDTLIETEKGLMYLDEVYDFSSIEDGQFCGYESGLKVYNHDLKLVDISDGYNNGIKEIWNTQLENGSFINSTHNERVMIFNELSKTEEWKLVSDLIIGDLVKIK